MFEVTMKLDKFAFAMLISTAAWFVNYLQAIGYLQPTDQSRYMLMAVAGMCAVYSIGYIWRLNMKGNYGKGAADTNDRGPSQD